MLTIKRQRFMCIGIIVLGVILLGMPAVYAQDEPNFPEWVGSADEEVDSNAADEEGLEVLGDLYEDLVYTPVTPCKIVDTRSGGGGFIAAGATRYYNVLNTSGQGGSYCSSPVGYPSAAHLAVTVVDPNGKGNLKVFPANTSGSTGLTINFNKIGTNIANAGTTKVVYGSGNDIGVKASFAGCHVTIQVLGYYTRPEATPVQTIRQVPGLTLLCAGGSNCTRSISCPAGYTMTGGGCNGASGLEIFENYPSSSTSWTCSARVWSSVSIGLFPYALCTRVPGR